MRTNVLVACLTAAILLTACNRQDKPKLTDAGLTKSAASSVVPVARLPDVGRIEQVTVTTQGSGPTAGVAVQEAMKLAILEVNGATIDTSSVVVKFGLDVTEGQTEAMLRGSAFAESIAQRSQGAITGFKVVSMTEPVAQGGLYGVTIEASIAKFRAPVDAKKIKIAISPLHTNAGSFFVGTQTVPATKVAEVIRQGLMDALTATGRFSVLDRDFGSDVQQELDLVATGQTPKTELAKLSQTLSADIVWVGMINNFSYVRNVRKLSTSDRDLVSYSGGWSVSQRILNMATRQIMLSNTLQERVPSTDPTTMDQGIDAGQAAQSMESAIVDEAVAGIISQTFPVTIVAIDGMNVVLSQGGRSVKVGRRYAVVSMGKELTDPQTQESLGRMESPCCDVVIDRVTATLAYGHLENAKIAVDSVVPSGLRIEEEIPPGKLLAVEMPLVERSKGRSMTPPKNGSVGDQPPSTSAPSDDNKKW